MVSDSSQEPRKPLQPTAAHFSSFISTWCSPWQIVSLSHMELFAASQAQAVLSHFSLPLSFSPALIYYSSFKFHVLHHFFQKVLHLTLLWPTQHRSCAPGASLHLVQLTLEQQGFGVRVSTFMWIFFPTQLDLLIHSFRTCELRQPRMENGIVTFPSADFQPRTENTVFHPRLVESAVVKDWL